MLQDVLQVFMWTFALGAALAIPMSVRKSAFLCLGWLAIYGLAYWYLSINGRYVQDRVAEPTRWMPLHCEKVVSHGNREVARLNGMGAFFAPLVLADRVLVHRPKSGVEAARLQRSLDAI